MFQHTAARRRLRYHPHKRFVFPRVSTHSRPKAAAGFYGLVCCNGISFNTQPPEGGCLCHEKKNKKILAFQHTAARRRLLMRSTVYADKQKFQHTAARRRLLARDKSGKLAEDVSTHSRPKAAARYLEILRPNSGVSTHSRPKAAAPYIKKQEKSAN